MIKKERKIPLSIQKIEALLRRLPDDHPMRDKMKEDLAKSWAGYRGEQSVDYYLSFLQKKNLLFYLILEFLVVTGVSFN